jgi:hypothetical protein
MEIIAAAISSTKKKTLVPREVPARIIHHYPNVSSKIC